MNNCKKLLINIDYLTSANWLKFIGEKKSLLIIVFHRLLNSKDRAEIEKNFPLPCPQVTGEKFRGFIKYFMELDYKFVSPKEVTEHSKDKSNLIMITFDDGYFNNINALPILDEYKIPAVFFISTDHVKKNKGFWWDVLSREGINRGKSKREIIKTIRNLKNRKTCEIEKFIIDKLGISKKSFRPKSDLDRPFSPSELLDFSKNNNVFLGNHTKNHAILTNYSDDEIKEQILSAQNYIYKLTGKKPNIISYPNGYYSLRLIQLIETLGFEVGVTTISKKNYLPLSNSKTALLKLGRLTFKGDEDVEFQGANFRSDISIGNLYKFIKTHIEKHK